MASFDFIECSMKAYSYVWKRRGELLGPSIMVIGLKFLLFMSVFSLGLEDNPLRQGLVFLPAFFAEGWIIAHAIHRALSLEESSAYAVGGIRDIDLKRAVSASMVVYVLTKMLLAFLVGMPYALDPAAMSGESGPTDSGNIGTLVLIFMIMIFLIWAFRFLWFYIPPALGLSIEAFMKKISPFKSSLYMIGMWLMCSIPLLLLLVLVREFALAPFPPLAEGEAPGMMYRAVMGLVTTGFDYLLSLLTSLGMAYGVASIFNSENKNVSLW